MMSDPNLYWGFTIGVCWVLFLMALFTLSAS